MISHPCLLIGEVSGVFASQSTILSMWINEGDFPSAGHKHSRGHRDTVEQGMRESVGSPGDREVLGVDSPSRNQAACFPFPPSHASGV